MDGHIAGGGGPEARPESPRADPVAGELVTETLGYDGGRPVTVYVPQDPPEVVVFAGDGQRVARWGGPEEAHRLIREGCARAREKGDRVRGA